MIPRMVLVQAVTHLTLLGDDAPHFASLYGDDVLEALEAEGWILVEREGKRSSWTFEVTKAGEEVAAEFDG